MLNDTFHRLIEAPWRQNNAIAHIWDWSCPGEARSPTETTGDVCKETEKADNHGPGSGSATGMVAPEPPTSNHRWIVNND